MDSFNLEKQIAEWRQEMFRSGIRNPEVLDELEAHLRERVESLVASRSTRQTAFETAVSQLGSSAGLGREFRKLGGNTRRSAIAAVVACGLVALVFPALGSQRISSQHWSPLFTAHVTSLTAGYLAAFMSGVLGIGQVLNRCFRSMPLLPEVSTRRIFVWLNAIAAVLVGVGIVTGVIWSNANLGSYLGGEARGAASVCIWAWLLITLVIHHRGRADLHDLSLAAIACNLLVGLGWFGTGIMAYSHSNGQGDFMWFWAFVWGHLFLLLLGIATRNGGCWRSA